MKLKKAITSIVVAFGLFLSAFITSSAMAGSYAVGIIAGAGSVETKGSETEGYHDTYTSGTLETTETTIKQAIRFGSLFAEYAFGEKYGLTVGASYTPTAESLGAKTRSDTVSNSKETSTDTGTYKAEADISGHATIYIEHVCSILVWAMNKWF